MTVSSEISRFTYNGDGVSTTFPYPARFLAKEDLVVLGADVLGVEVYLDLDVDYTVSGAGDQAGGSVTLLAPAPAGVRITIYGDPAIKQSLDLEENDKAPAEEFERAYDRLTLISQRLKDQFDRTLKLKEGFTGAFDPSLPGLLVPNSTFAVNSAGTGFVSGPLIGDISDASAAAASALSSATIASTSAAASETSAQESGSFATAAALSAGSSLASADAAADSELAAYGSASESATSATAAQTFRTQAGNSATASAASATASGVSATASQTSATNSANSASAAANSATAAATSETNAGNSATAAAGSAGGAATAVANHNSQTSGVHGVAGNVVGTSDNQVITNKDLDGGTATNTRRLTTPKNSKSNLDALTRKEATLLYGSDTKKLYVDDGSSLKPVGSGAGGGVNLLTLDSTFQPNAGDNYDFEASAGTWVGYADAAGLVPVDMTGGTPGTTVARVTTSPLNGGASLKIDLGSGSSRQGEGVSTLVYVPAGYRGQKLTLKFPYSMVGAIGDGDLIPYVYDVTNSVLVSPEFYSKITGTTGAARASFTIPSTTASLRVGLHVARSVTTALSILIDDVTLAPESLGAAQINAFNTDWASYTPTFTGFGTVTNIAVQWKRVGDSMFVRGTFTPGTPTGVLLQMTLPNGTSISSSISALTNVGITGQAQPSATNLYALALGGINYLQFGEQSSTRGGLVPGNGTSLVYAATAYSINAGPIPISQWFGVMAGAIITKDPVTLLSGQATNVTSFGTSPIVGQYRSLIRAGNSNTYTDSPPATLPAAGTGFRIYVANAGYAQSDTTNQPSRYEIFIGKGLNDTNWNLRWGQNAGPTGNFNVTPIINNTNTIGVYPGYDPLTGILTITHAQDGAATNMFTGRPVDAATAPVRGAYFEVELLSNALAAGLTQTQNAVVVAGGNGYGSTNTRIRRYSTILENKGSAITYADSPTLGASFTINEDGLYAMYQVDYSSSSTMFLGFSKNSTDLSNGITAINAANNLMNSVVAQPVGESSASGFAFLVKGDVVRPHQGASSATLTTLNGSRSAIWKVPTPFETVGASGGGSQEISAQVSSTTNLAVTGGTDIVFPTVNWDTSNVYNPTNGRFTPQVPGRYTISSAGMNPNGVIYINVHKNGVFVNTMALLQNASFVNGGEVSAYLNGTTDYLSVRASASVTLNVSAGNYLPMITFKKMN